MSFPCPAPLFVELMRVDELRMRRALLRQDRGRVAYLANDGRLKMNNKPVSPLEATLAQRQREGAEHEAVALLIRIMGFQVAEWAANKDADRGRCGAWVRLGNMYQSAMVLFAILSLAMSPDEAGSHGSVPLPWPGVTQPAAAHGKHADSLAAEIERAVDEPGHLWMPVCWPTIVLGVSAAKDPPASRSIVSRCLLRLGLDHGTALPLKANEVLMQFWTTGKMEWDECFDRPYAFFT